MAEGKGLFIPTAELRERIKDELLALEKQRQNLMAALERLDATGHCFSEKEKDEE